MASIKLIPILLVLSLSASGQAWAEWFNQQNTKKQYLLQQLAALQAYASVLKTGYNVAHNGLSSIGGFNQDEFRLHATHYAHLKAPSPTVKNHAQVKEILQWQQDINKAFSQLRPDAYYNQVKAAVLKDCGRELTELQKVITDNRLDMSDADRLKRIGAIHAGMLGNYRFTLSFCDDTALLTTDEQTTGLKTLKQLYGNH
jgi:hypothetical protein